jgi:hypothetical protein
MYVDPQSDVFALYMRRKGEQMYPQMRNWEFQDKVRQHLLATNAGQIMNTAAFEKPPPEPFPNWVSPDVADRMLPGSRMAAMSRQLGHNMEIEMLANDPMMKFKRAMEASQMMQQGPEQPQEPVEEEPKAIEEPKEDPVGPSKVIPFKAFKEMTSPEPPKEPEPPKQPEPVEEQADTGERDKKFRIMLDASKKAAEHHKYKAPGETERKPRFELGGNATSRVPTRSSRQWREYRPKPDGVPYPEKPPGAPFPEAKPDRYFWNIPGKIYDKARGM